VESVWLSLITFGNGEAKLHTKLTELSGFNQENFIVSGKGTPIGEALSLLAKTVVKDVNPWSF